MSSVYTLSKIKEEVKKISLSEEHYNRTMNLIDKIKDIELSAYDQGFDQVFETSEKDYFVYQGRINSLYKGLIIKLSELTK